jgi:hypothetical protein
MASSAIKGIMSFFKGKESKKEEAAEKKLTPKQYARGEKAEGEKAKSTPAKKAMGSAAAKKPTFPVKKTATKKK